MAGFALKIKTKVGQQVVQNLTPESTIKDLKQLLSKISNIPVHKLQVLSGFPPKTLDLSGDHLSLHASGITSGDTLILEEKTIADKQENRTIINSSTTRTQTNDAQFAEQVSLPRGILMKHVVPSDNSCLFTSIFFVLNGKEDDTGTVASWMRQMIAQTIERDPENFSEAILGKSMEEYCKWIQEDTSWGGAIELSILSNYYGIEIAVADTINAIINRFGEDQNYSHRVFLLFDGIHYDPLYLEPFEGGTIQTIFPADDLILLGDAETLVKEANSSRQFTDVNKFSLKCYQCNILLSGQVQAQQHAQSTGHTQFGEI
ncbi:hypothetical protein AMK59_6610 [Oryctes borbonicus]|uniref:Ubiquitin thioesterase OTU n=1 Tax=Oryctes borbonicus TaxID=1629725 RepID=A0A0T6AYU5_9SCAR|nr:hypothetical protein AMK59_6610 [Oryctes borbonicus]